MRCPYLFFDLDGTLTDPAQGICGSVQYALRRGGYPVGPLEDYFSWIGPPLLFSFREQLKVDEAEARRLLEYYRERFSTRGLLENQVYPGIPALLQRLRQAGARMAVATGKPTVYAERILEHFGLRQYFETVSGIDLNNEPMTKQGVLQTAMTRLGSPPREQCLMIGDRSHDAQGAAACGIDCALVLYGCGSRAEAEASSPRYIAASVAELETLLLG